MLYFQLEMQSHVILQACKGLGIEALRKELRLEVMREIMEDTESLVCLLTPFP